VRRPPGELPPRLLSADATDFERRVLEAARGSKPSAAASARMARALGVATGTIATAAAAKTLAASAAASKATAASVAAVWPWVSAGVLGLAVAGGLLGARARHALSPEPHRAAPPAIALAGLPAVAPPAALGAPTRPAVEVAEPQALRPAPIHRSRAAASTSDVRDEIALLDAARAEVSARNDRGAFEILRRYKDKYPAGSFRPEAAAIKVEVLLDLGREAEARALAERLVAEHRGSLLARRVAALAGLTDPSTL
jgi:hypothetical protein